MPILSVTKDTTTQFGMSKYVITIEDVYLEFVNIFYA